MENKEYTHRYIARVVLEAETPLFVGSGETALLKDALVQRDMHGFPMIQGTSLAGVLRHALENNETDKGKWNSFFGYQSPKGNDGRGSQVKISSAYLVLENGKVAEGLQPGFDLSEYKKYFEDLPVRHHVRINEKGVGEKHGLFDNEVVYKGCRFLFEIELKGDANDNELWNIFLSQLKSPLFRLGQGTRNGYGDLSVRSCKTKTFDLKNGAFDDYLNYDNSLNATNDCLEVLKVSGNNKNLTHYRLELKPENFFMFGAGYGDDDVDNVPIREGVVIYKNDTIQEPEEQTLIPASSIKGALCHRTAFYYNREINRYADNYDNKDKENTQKIIEFVESNNDAVYELFGAEEGHTQRAGKRGKIILNDILISNVKGIKNDKVFNHLAIDRFTGGAMDGALFSEKVSYFEDKDKIIDIDIYVEELDKDLKEKQKEKIILAFEDSLKDVCKGLLPLGGMTTKGHGIFTGKLIKDEKEMYSYE